jgi:hypothetical protein
LPLLNSRTSQRLAEYCLEIKDISGLFRISFFSTIFQEFQGPYEPCTNSFQKIWPNKIFMSAVPKELLHLWDTHLYIFKYDFPVHLW